MNVELTEKELLAKQLENAFFQAFVECEDIDSSNDNEAIVVVGKSEEEILGEAFFQTFIGYEDVDSSNDNETIVFIGKSE